MSSAVVPARRFRFAPILTATIVTVLLLWLFGAAAEIFLLLFVGIILSLYLGAVTDFIVRRLRVHDHHAPRGLAFTLALLLTLCGISGLFVLLIPPVVDQTRQLVTVLPNYISTWEAGLERLAERTPALRGAVRPGEHQIMGAIYTQLTHLAQGVVPKVVSIVHIFINIFSVAVMAIYLALRPADYREWLIALFPPVHRDLIRDVLGDLASQLRSWIVSQLLAMITLAALTAVGLYLLRVPYWLTFGIFTGAVAIVPFFGTLVSTVLPALFVLGGDGIWGLGPGGHASLVVILGIVIHLIEGNLVVPLIVANKVKVPPVLSIMSVLVVGKLLGPLGLLVAVPMLVSIMVVVRRILVNRIYEGQGFRRTPRDRVLVLRVPAPDGGVVLPDGHPPDLVAIAERDGDRGGDRGGGGGGVERKIA